MAEEEEEEEEEEEGRSLSGGEAGETTMTEELR